ncbi:MAG: hypothetical protein F6K65_09545 [Moorea sp. SIO3C2]|nr:hypothetical protein [Moorena sp. SIO3C2]
MSDCRGFPHSRFASRQQFIVIAVEVKLKTSSAPCSLLPAPFQPKDYVLNYTCLAIGRYRQID